jgi:hypothetical protein
MVSYLFILSASQSLTILQIQYTCLANILQLCAVLTDFGLFVTHVGSRKPAEDGKWTITSLAFFAKRLFRHAYVRIVAQTGFAEDWEFLQ